MKKYKYQRLSKKEAKEVKEAFYKTNQGIDLKKRFNRILIYSILLLLFGMYLIVDAIINNEATIEYVYAGLLILFSIIFLISRNYLVMIKVNDYLTKNTTKKK